MLPQPDPPLPLYAQILGPSWSDLADSVRRLHETGSGLNATGTFRVRRGDNRLARLLATLAGMPKAGDAVPMQLVVEAFVGGEDWRRSFGGRPLVSKQGDHPSGLLLERMGSMEMRFALAVENGALGYQSRRVTLCLSLLRVPLPRWLAPRVTAWEKPGPDGQVQISVESRLPLVGRLISYEGMIVVDKTGPDG